MDKLWLIEKKCDWTADESCGVDTVNEFVYKGTEESVKKYIEQYGKKKEYDGCYCEIKYLQYKEYEYPKIWTTFPEDFDKT